MKQRSLALATKLQHHQSPIVITDPLIQQDCIVNPNTVAITKLRLKRVSIVRQPDMSRAGGKIATSRPPQTTIGVRQAIIQI